MPFILPRISPWGALTIAVLVASQAGVLIRLANAPALAILFWRLLIGSAILLPFTLKSWRKSGALQLSKRDLGLLVLTGTVLFVHFYWFFVSVQKMSIAASMVLFSINPVTTALGAWLIFRHQLKVRLLWAAALGTASVLVLFLPAATPSREGVMLGLGSAVTFSLYVLIGKSLRQRLSNLFFTQAIWLVALIGCSLAMLAAEVSFTDYSAETYGYFVALALLPTLIGHTVFTWCLNHIDINAISCVTLTEPVLAAIVAGFVFDEAMTLSLDIAFLLAAASVLAICWPWLKNQYQLRKLKKS